MAKTTKKKQTINNNLDTDLFFASPVYSISRSDFLKTVSVVSEESIEQSKQHVEMNTLWPHMMSGDFSQDKRIESFTQFVLSTCWNIMVSQGYKMAQYELGFTAMWTQEHHLNSDMPEHVHSDYSQLVAFYFLEVPESGSALVIHDPRPGKVQIDLRPENLQEITHASRQIFIRPNAGDLIITNAYLAHSFTRNMNEKPTKFVHMNIAAWPLQAAACGTEGPEII